MARSTFGGTGNDYLFDNSGRFVKLVTNRTFTCWSAATGGTQYTDLLNAAGSAVTAITTDANGFYSFQGPDSVLSVWADTGTGTRSKIVTNDGPSNAAIDARISVALPSAVAGKADKANLAVNVKTDYGAKGDGTTDDTTAIQNALASSTLAAPKQIYFPAGTYLISGTLTLPFAPGMSLRGDSRLGTVIKRNNAGPIIKGASQDLHSVTISDLRLTWTTASTSANTDNYAIQWSRPTGSAGDWGQYHWNLERLTVQNAYTAFGMKTGDGAFTVWGLSIDTCIVTGTAHRVLDLGIGGGKPSIFVRNCYFSNTGNGLVPDAECIYAVACDLTLISVDIEGWYGKVIYGSGTTTPIVAHAVHVENCFSNGSVTFIDNADGGITGSGISVTGTTVSGSSVCYIFHVGINGQLNVSGLVTNINLTTTDLYAARGETGASLRLDGAIQTAGSEPFLAPFYTPDSTSKPAARLFNGVNYFGYGTTANRPDSTFYTPSATYLDTDVLKPVWLDNGGTQAWRDALGYKTDFATKTANYTVVDGDRVVVANGTSLTITLPDPTTVTAGQRPITVKNIAATSVTVNSAGTSKTLDGAASQSLAQWAKATYVSNGTQWLTI